jgi:DNA-binding transcriptional MerR regulator
MASMSIGDVARRAGLPPSTLRYYEEAGILPAPARASGQRRYDAAIFDALRLIQLAQAAGLTIAEIRALLDDAAPLASPAERWGPIARRKLQEADEQIALLERRKQVLAELLACTCTSLDDCARA